MSLFERLLRRSRPPEMVCVTPVERMLESMVNDKLPQLKALVQSGDLPLDYKFGRTDRSLLHVAASFGALNCMLYLAGLGLDVNAKDKGDTTPAHLAARNGQRACLKALVETLHADLSVPDASGYTVLHWLASNGRTDLLLYLLNMGQSIDVRDRSGQSLLHIACHTGHTGVVVELLARGASPDTLDRHGRTPLHYICKHGQPACAALLFSAGAKLLEDGDGKLPITLALEHNHPECTAVLIVQRPWLVSHLWAALSNLAYEEQQVSAVLYHIAAQGGSAVIQRVYHALVEETLLRGQELLCYKISGCGVDDGSIFLRFVRGACNLLRDVQHHPELSQDEALVRVMHGRLALLDALWDALEQWLLLGEEPDHSDEDEAYPLQKQSRRAQLCAAVHGAWLTATAAGSLPRFDALVTRHLSLLRDFVRGEPTLIFDHFSFVLHSPSFMSAFADVIQQQPLAERQTWLYRNLVPPGEVLEFSEEQVTRLSRHSPTRTSSPVTPDRQAPTLVVDRQDILASSCRLLSGDTSPWKMKFGVQFAGEAAHGDGVKREWLTLLSRSLLNEDYGLFVRGADGTYAPSPQSWVNPDHLNFFHFAGRAVGLAIYHHELLGVRFSRSFCKHIVGQPLDVDGLGDLEASDPALARSLRWLLESELTPELTDDLMFVAPRDAFGWWPDIPLLSGGETLQVTEENKREYVALMCQWKLRKVIEPQLRAFLTGLHDFVPPALLALFSAEELDLLISGAPSVDIDDWRQHTELSNISVDDEQLDWFWEIVGEYSHVQRQQLLQFATGSPAVPVGGFRHMQGAEGPRPFTLARVDTDGALPTAATCFNLLRLPTYTSKAAMKKSLDMVISCATEGFDFA